MAGIGKLHLSRGLRAQSTLNMTGGWTPQARGRYLACSRCWKCLPGRQLLSLEFDLCRVRANAISTGRFPPL